MSPSIRVRFQAALACLYLAAFLAPEALAAQATGPAAALPAADGRWEGALDLAGLILPFRLTLFPGGGLLDIPDQELYGYPLALAERGPGSLRLVAAVSEPPLRLEGALVPSAAGGERYEGSFSGGEGVAGSFYLVHSALQADPERAFAIDTGRGVLPATLEPATPGPEGLERTVLLIVGGGRQDRDGNNYNVPGRNDAFRLLAAALAEAGLASLRFDPRGTGAAYPLVRDEASLVYDDHISDVAAAIRALRADGRFDRVLVLGVADGALIAAAASLIEAPEGLAIVAAGGASLKEIVEASLAEESPELRAEARALMAALAEGRPVAEPSPYLADFFRPGFRPFLASWLRHSLVEALGAYKGPVLLLQGELDLQVSLEDFERLAAARPDALAAIVPSMNHTLKRVGNDVEDNLAAFTDPGYPIAPALAPALIDFAKELN